MKKILLAAFLVLVSFAFVACDYSKKKLQADIEAFNDKSCPVDLGMVGELSSLTYSPEENEVTMTMTFSRNIPFKPSALQGLKNTLKKMVFTNWVESDDVKGTFKEIVDADASLRLVMQNATEDDWLELKVSRSEVKDVVEGNIDVLSPRDMLDFMVSVTNSQCPMHVDEVTTLSSASIEGSNFVYNYSVDESVADMDVLETNLSMVENAVRTKLSSNDPTVVNLLNICRAADADMIYRYVGDQTGKRCQFKMIVSEL